MLIRLYKNGCTWNRFEIKTTLETQIATMAQKQIPTKDASRRTTIHLESGGVLKLSPKRFGVLLENPDELRALIKQHSRTRPKKGAARCRSKSNRRGPSGHSLANHHRPSAITSPKFNGASR